MSKLPAFQFYPGDWRKDPGVQALDFYERGVWFEMLCLLHESDERGVMLLNGKPMSDEALARTLGLDKQNLTTALTKILDYGVATRRESDGAIVCRRMVRDEELRQTRKKAGKLGGNPVLLKQNPTTPVKQNPTPSSSSSSSSSTTTSVVQDKSAATASGFDWDSDCPPSLKTPEAATAFDRWQEYRRESKLAKWKPVTIRACLAKFERHGAKAFADAVEQSISNGWRGLFEPGGGSGGTRERKNDRNTYGQDAASKAELLERMKNCRKPVEVRNAI